MLFANYFDSKEVNVIRLGWSGGVFGDLLRWKKGREGGLVEEGRVVSDRVVVCGRIVAFIRLFGLFVWR